MTDLHRRISELSPARRELLERLMREKGVPLAGLAIRPTRRTAAEQPLSYAQQRLWFFEQMEPGSNVYNVFDTIVFDEDIDPKLIERGLNEIVRRHEVLRTTFTDHRGQPMQVVAESAELTLRVLDLRQLPDAEREIAMQRIVDETARQPFDLGSGPLLRTTLLRIGDRETALLLCMHHIISDAWSLEVFENELRALCASYADGEASPLRPLPIQYADYVAWQRESLQGEMLESQLGYWKAQLTGAPTVLELPTAHARPPAPTYKGATRWHRLPVPLGQAVGTTSRSEGVTPFMLTIAAFAVVLWRYTEQTDFLIGTPVAGRNRAETEPLIGFFVNTLALRLDLSGDPSFRDLLKRVREVCVGAYAHQDLPFEMVVEALQPARDPSRNPLFQISFQFSKVPTPIGEGGTGDEERDLPLDGQTDVVESAAKFDLSVNVWDDGHAAKVQADYSTDLFDDSMIARLLRHFECVLDGATRRPEERISRLPLAGQAERRLAVEVWNDTLAPFPDADRLEALFARRAAAAPDAIAIQAADEALTYAQLNARAARLQRVLAARGVGIETVVGLLMERSIGMVVGMLAILKAGAAYAPLDPEYPSERLALLARESSIRVIVTESRFAAAMAVEDVAVVLVDDDATAPDAPAADASVELPAELGGGPSLAYVMYTSGSTGRPKGVAVTHAAVTRTVCNTNYLTIDSADRIALASNPSFDAATFEVWGALLHGATLVVVPKSRMIVPERLAETLRSAEISVMFLTSALVSQVVARVPDAFAAMRCLIFGGDAADPAAVREILRAGPPQRLLNAYGPTECTTFSTWHLVDDLPADATSIPIGIPLSNTQVYLLDRHLQPVPIGVAGELYIGGNGLARGYVDQPRSTADNFLPDPFGRTAGGRLYRTGDIGRYQPSGAIEFLGRRDHQVKLRGYRIELGEVEAVLRNHPAVREVLVLCTDDPRGDKRMVAYIVTSPGDSVSAADLRTHMQRSVPEYLVPSAFVTLPELPLTPNGKVDRRALPDPEEVRLEAGVPGALPTTPAERAVADIFASVLRLDGVGRDESFFELGGHSLLATQIVARVREALGVDVPLRVLFTSPTVAGFAAAISQALGTDAEAPSSLIPPVDRGRFSARRTTAGHLEISAELRELLRDDAHE